MKFAQVITTGATLALLILPVALHAQTSSLDQLRATIKAEITADPRSQNMTPAQINALVDSLTTQAAKQGLTTSQLTYRPQVPGESASTLSYCSSFSCSLGQAFGLDGSIPFIPIALIVLAVLFIAIYSLMREFGHPHVTGVNRPQA